MRDLTSASKFISLVLRHDPKLIQLDMNENGWVDIEQLISNAKKFKNIEFSRQDIDTIVETNNKKRFTISEDGNSIRANQGHSIDVDVELKQTIPPAILYHGTATRFITAIRAEGIKSMSRKHVHLSELYQTAVSVGSRHGKPYVFGVDCESMVKDGYKFYLSENSVWLTDEVPSKYVFMPEYGLMRKE